MKSTYVVAFFAIVGITSTNLFTMDFLNDPFFKQLAGELDSMFGTGPADDAPLPAYAPAKPASPFGGGFGAQKPSTPSPSKNDTATPTVPLIADAAKDLKTLFLENLELSKAPAGAFGSPAQKQTKIIISKKRTQAYNLYMGDLVKKSRLIERIVASNPARTFGYRFLVSFDEVVDFVDKIEIVHQLILSKKMYLRNFFGQPMQKTREQIVALLPKLDATLRKLRPLLNKEEALDDDITRMQREAKRPAITKAPSAKGKKKGEAKRTAPASDKIGRALPPPKKFDWPKYKPTPPAKAKKPAQKKHTAPLPPVHQQNKEPFPRDFSLKQFMHERGVS